MSQTRRIARLAEGKPFGPMSPEELRTIMFKIGCATPGQVAAQIGVSTAAVRGWLEGGVCGPAAMLLRLLAKA